MMDKAHVDRIERMRTEVSSAMARADQLIARVADQKFKEAITRIRVSIAGHDSFFLDGADEVLPQNLAMWLTGAETLLAGEYAALQYWENEARARDYKIALLG